MYTTSSSVLTLQGATQFNTNDIKEDLYMFAKFKSAVSSFFRRVKVGFKKKVDAIKKVFKTGIDKVKEAEEYIETEPKMTFLAYSFIAAVAFLVVRNFLPSNVLRGYCITCLMFISGMTTIAWRKAKHKKDVEDVVSYASAE